MNNIIVVKTFISDVIMGEWLSDPRNLDDLKKKYPPSDFTAHVDLIDRMVIVNPKVQHLSDCSSNNLGVPDLLGPCDCGL